MSTPKFDALVEKVRSWANRDDVVLSDEIITDFLDYSADYCYRNLRIPPLEYVYQYPAIIEDSVGETSLQLPPDFSELINFARITSDGKRYTFNKNLAQSEFNNETTIKPENSFAYKNGQILFYPESKLGDVYELYYYRRLFDLDATYVVNQNNIDIGNCTEVSVDEPEAVEFPQGSDTYYVGKEVYNWLRDDNERALLFGALAHAFEYLGEEQKSLGYQQKQDALLQELNREEKFRKTKGAVNTVTYEVSELL